MCSCFFCAQNWMRLCQTAMPQVKRRFLLQNGLKPVQKSIQQGVRYPVDVNGHRFLRVRCSNDVISESDISSLMELLKNYSLTVLNILFSLTHPFLFLNAKSIFQIQFHCILIPFSYMQNNFFISLFFYMIHSPE